MRQNWVSVFLTAFFLIGGLIFWVFLPEIWIGQIWVGVAIFLIVLQVWLKIKADQQWTNTETQTAIQNTLKGMSAMQTNASTTMGADVGQQIIEALKAQGIDTTNGATVDLTDLPQARDAVLAALKAGGIDVAHQLAVAAPAIPIQASGEPVEAMTKLEQLKSAGLISDAEFQENRQRILKGL